MNDDLGTLNIGEFHPSASSAMNFVMAYKIENLQRWFMLKEAIASTALSGNRLAQILHGTLDRLSKSEPVSDRYILGLAWFIQNQYELKRGGEKTMVDETQQPAATPSDAGNSAANPATETPAPEQPAAEAPVAPAQEAPATTEASAPASEPQAPSVAETPATPSEPTPATGEEVPGQAPVADKNKIEVPEVSTTGEKTE